MKNFYGCLFRQIRTERGFSIESLAKGIGISKGTLWEAEQGKRNLSKSTFEAGLKFMKISYREIEKSKEEIMTLLQDFIRACYFGNKDEVKKIEEQFLNLHFDRHKTFNDFYYHLLILETLLDLNKQDQTLHSKIAQAISYLKKASSCFCMGLKDLYHYVMVCWMSYDGRIMEIENYIENLFSLNTQEIYPHIQMIIGYHFLRSTIHNRSMQKAHKLIILLRSVLQQDMNYKGLIHLDHLEGVCFILIEEYEEAIEKFQAVIRNIQLFSLNDLPLKVEAYNSLLWSYIMKEDYSNALEVADLFESLFGCEQENRNLVFAIYCEYRLGYLVQASQRLKKMEKALASSKCFIDHVALEVFQALLTQNTKSFESKCEEILAELVVQDRLIAELAFFLLKILLFEAERNNQPKKAYLLRKRMSLIRHKM